MQNIFVTGANRGLGLEFTRRYIERGERVFAGCRQPQDAGYLQALRQQWPESLTVVKLDVADAGSILDAFALIQMKIKGLDLLINNAGVYLGRRGAPESSSDDLTGDALGSLDMDDAVGMFQTNAIGPILLAQQFLNLLKAGNRPRVISISSGYASLTDNHWGEPYHYSASKAALNMYMRSLAVDVKNLGIIVNLLSPGWVQTEMGGASAPLKPLQSVDGMVQIIDNLKMEHTGTFLDWQGRTINW